MSDNLKLSNQICHRYYVASNAITRAYRPFLTELDLTYPQYIVMLSMWENDEVDIGHIKQETMIDGGALSLMLKKLELKGLLHLKISEQDARSKIVCLTGAGKSLKAEAEDIPGKLLCQVPQLSLEEVELVKSISDKVISSLKS